jgi:NAD(P)-dependent dehydrogenase (short-subunit alcohol dehydrogenase family)
MSTDRVALVTNVEQYAGPGSVDALLAAGWTVIAHDRRWPADEMRREQFGSANPNVLALGEAEPHDLVARALTELGHIDALVSNDVVHPVTRPIEECTLDELRQGLHDGLVWPFALASAVVPSMKGRRSGALVFITSGTAIRPHANATIYSAARAGASALAVALSKELGPNNIQVNAIGPNWSESETYFPAERRASPQLAEALEREVPIRRLGRQEEMGALVALPASQAATSMTGQFIAFGGGIYP